MTPDAPTRAPADVWTGRDVFITGHTGFKGSWLALALADAGARVHGYALPPAASADGRPALFDMLGLAPRMASHTLADLRDPAALERAWRASGADALFHLAAQPLVRESHRAPYETFAVNAMGTVAALEAVRRVGRACAAVLVATDKCYENDGRVWGYRECDPLGGSDPYSASKAAAELAASAYRRSFFPAARLASHGVRVASARAGNVIGGGDWAADRIVPDLVRAWSDGRMAEVRNPRAVRPWQHVLEPLSGYLLLGGRMLSEPLAAAWCASWNFGPRPGDEWPVARLADALADAWGPDAPGWRSAADPAAPPEADELRLCADKALHRLGWRPRWGVAEAAARTAAWYRAAARPGFDAAAACRADLVDHAAMASKQ